MPPRTGICKNGHAVEGDNMIERLDGTRACRTCRDHYNLLRPRRASRIAQARWREKHPDSYRNNHVSRYGITLDDYNRLFAEQGGVCAICHKPERHMNKNGKPASLCVDHDHGTGTVRGLLCRACNSALGFIEDLPERADAMATYLRLPRGYRGPGTEGMEVTALDEPMERR